MKQLPVMAMLKSLLTHAPGRQIRRSGNSGILLPEANLEPFSLIFGYRSAILCQFADYFSGGMDSVGMLTGWLSYVAT